MRTLLVTLVVLLLAAACSPLEINPGGPVTLVPNPTLAPALVSTAGPSVTPTATSTSSPTQALSGTGIPAPVPTQTAPLSTPPSGWKTYTGPQSAFQIDYPADWTVAEQNGVVEFEFEVGQLIMLAPVNTGGISPPVYLANVDIPNTHCVQQSSRFGMAFSQCFDKIARTSAAHFLTRDAQGAIGLYSLSLGRNGDMQVFEHMLDSLRPVK